MANRVQDQLLERAQLHRARAGGQDLLQLPRQRQKNLLALQWQKNRGLLDLRRARTTCLWNLPWQTVPQLRILFGQGLAERSVRGEQSGALVLPKPVRDAGFGAARATRAAEFISA